MQHVHGVSSKQIEVSSVVTLESNCCHGHTLLCQSLNALDSTLQFKKGYMYTNGNIFTHLLSPEFKTSYKILCFIRTSYSKVPAILLVVTVCYQNKLLSLYSVHVCCVHPIFQQVLPFFMVCTLVC